MKAAPFRYHAPTTTAGVLDLLDDLGDGAKVIAGGQSLMPMLAMRLAVFDDLIDLNRVPALRGVSVGRGFLRVAACTTEATVGADPVVAASVPLLSLVTPLIGHFQIRNRGTLGGVIAHADPAAEYPAVALALDATIEVASPGGAREIRARDFFAGLWTTTMEPDELLVGVRFPVWDGRSGFAVREFARRHGDFAIAGAVVGVSLDAAERVVRAAIGLIGMGSTPERGTAAERAAVGAFAGDLDPAELGRLAVSKLENVPGDQQGSEDYRRQIASVMVGRAWSAAIEEARNA